MRENDDFITDRKTLTEEIERITGNIVKVTFVTFFVSFSMI